MPVNLNPVKTIRMFILATMIVVISGINEANAMANDYVIYITRHAEKAPEVSNPPLSAEGSQRAQMLAQLLSKAGIQAIYTTPYQRTEDTAAPLAKILEIAPEHYRAGEGQQLLETVRRNAQTVLIVGHSNTVPQLVRALGGETEDLTEQDYGDLYQLHMREGTPELVRLMIPTGSAVKF
ncbi:histidine phosphatase family protein [Pseudidiomarina sediminum]|uniref:Histidine phosphatase family protein n=1 Tax=Pseudidiomarina sediminum TaxID=431675 RepID=A0A432Z3T4_9GAMM|nr:histidine phosphatase family protein [Pseudidiomarina sediminum]RUO72562.1 histidine phosphatase family protein [Pseudidiomarina sediminum]